MIFAVQARVPGTVLEQDGWKEVAVRYVQTQYSCHAGTGTMRKRKKG